MGWERKPWEMSIMSSAPSGMLSTMALKICQSSPSVCPAGMRTASYLTLSASASLCLSSASLVMRTLSTQPSSS